MKGLQKEEHLGTDNNDVCCATGPSKVLYSCALTSAWLKSTLKVLDCKTNEYSCNEGSDEGLLNRSTFINCSAQPELEGGQVDWSSPNPLPPSSTGWENLSPELTPLPSLHPFCRLYQRWGLGGGMRGGLGDRGCRQAGSPGSSPKWSSILHPPDSTVNLYWTRVCGVGCGEVRLSHCSFCEARELHQGAACQSVPSKEKAESSFTIARGLWMDSVLGLCRSNNIY